MAIAYCAFGVDSRVSANSRSLIAVSPTSSWSVAASAACSNCHQSPGISAPAR